MDTNTDKNNWNSSIGSSRRVVTIRVAILLAVISVLGVFFGLPAYINKKLYPFLMIGSGHVSDEGVSTWTIAGHDFDIPNNYLMGRGGRGAVDQVNLVVIYPKMEGFSEKNQHEYECRGWCNKLSIAVYRINNPAKKDHTIAHKVRCFQSQSGLAFDNPPVCDEWDRVNSNPRIDFNYLEKNGKHYIIECSSDEDKAPSPSCEIKSDYGSGILYSIRFSSKYFENWPEIDEKVVGMISGFERQK